MLPSILLVTCYQLGVTEFVIGCRCWQSVLFSQKHVPDVLVLHSFLIAVFPSSHLSPFSTGQPKWSFYIQDILFGSKFFMTCHSLIVKLKIKCLNIVLSYKTLHEFLACSLALTIFSKLSPLLPPLLKKQKFREGFCCAHHCFLSS